MTHDVRLTLTVPADHRFSIMYFDDKMQGESLKMNLNKYRITKHGLSSSSITLNALDKTPGCFSKTDPPLNYIIQV